MSENISEAREGNLRLELEVKKQSEEIDRLRKRLSRMTKIAKRQAELKKEAIEAGGPKIPEETPATSEDFSELIQEEFRKIGKLARTLEQIESQQAYEELESICDQYETMLELSLLYIENMQERIKDSSKF